MGIGGLGIVKVNLGDPEYVDIVAKKDITILNNTNKEKRNIKYDLQVEELRAPIKVGDKIGKISVYEDNKFIYDVDLTIAYDIKKANIIKVFLRNLRDIFTININKN